MQKNAKYTLALPPHAAQELGQGLASISVAACSLRPEWEVALLAVGELADALSVKVAQNYRSFAPVKLHIGTSQAFALHLAMKNFLSKEALARDVLRSLDPWIVRQRGLQRSTFDRLRKELELETPLEQ